MTYNHDRAKVLCPMAAREVERLREQLAKYEHPDLCPTCVKALGVELAKKRPARAQS